MQLSWLERLTGSQEVVGSSPIFSTRFIIYFFFDFEKFFLAFSKSFFKSLSCESFAYLIMYKYPVKYKAHTTHPIINIPRFSITYFLNHDNHFFSVSKLQKLTEQKEPKYQQISPLVYLQKPKELLNKQKKRKRVLLGNISPRNP